MSGEKHLPILHMKKQKVEELVQLDKAGSEAAIQTQLFPIPKAIASLSWTFLQRQI